MKYLVHLSFVLLIALSGCDGPGGANGIPDTPQERRRLLDEKRQALLTLQKEIAQLESLLGADAGPRITATPKLVTTRTLMPSTFRRYAEIQGDVVPEYMNQISSETGGRLMKLLVKEGDQVSAGQLLASVDMEPLQKQLIELETSLTLATDLYERQKRLWEQKIGSEVQYLQAENTKVRLEKSMESLQSQLNKANIYAPISGVIDQLNYKQGDVAPPGMPIMRLINTRVLKVSAEAPERFVGTVDKGDRVKVRIPALNLEQDARISLVGKVVHPSNRTFKIETTLDDKNGVLKPNLLALVQIEDYREENAIVISVDLVQQEVGGKSYVFVATDTPEGKVPRKVYVRTGESYANQIVIKEGLEPGDQLIVRGARGLDINDLLEIQSSEDE
jgi:membrane fusion protein (multidrug efflux system)